TSSGWKNGGDGHCQASPDKGIILAPNRGRWSHEAINFFNFLLIYQLEFGLSDCLASEKS
ncbi:MAG: hypothetical protein ABR985_20005, partial [Methanotrichaceae archaeon]